LAAKLRPGNVHRADDWEELQQLDNWKRTSVETIKKLVEAITPKSSS
jgi:hypothetical protein